jgi:hypothetical protein
MVITSKYFCSNISAIYRMKKLAIISERVANQYIPKGLVLRGYKENYMQYTEMVEHIKKGGCARRLSWKASEFLWSNGKILIHNTPYFGESFNQMINGYVYVCECEDTIATDWMLCA